MTGRPQLEKAIDAPGVNDVLVVAECDRVTRSMQDGVALRAEELLTHGSVIESDLLGYRHGLPCCAWHGRIRIFDVLPRLATRKTTRTSRRRFLT